MVVFSSRLTLLDNMIEGTGFAHDKFHCIIMTVTSVTTHVLL